MNLATPDQIDEPTDLKVGTEAGELKDRISSYKGPKGWDGVNAWAIYNGEGNGNWVPQEVWSTDEPTVYENGVAGLTYDTANNFIAFQEYSEINCNCALSKPEDDCTPD